MINPNNNHFDDTGLTGEWQKEVYMLARDLLRKMSKLPESNGRNLTVIDVGCGSGWKLVHYLSKEFKTIGIETEPALSFLRKTYPDQVHTFIKVQQPLSILKIFIQSNPHCKYDS